MEKKNSKTRAGIVNNRDGDSGLTGRSRRNTEPDDGEEIRNDIAGDPGDETLQGRSHEDDDADTEVENSPNEDYGQMRESGSESMIEPGSIGKVEQVTEMLRGTQLDLAARRVLTQRGIEVGNAETGITREMEMTANDVPLRDILEASIPVAAAPIRRTTAGPALESIIGNDDRVRIFDTHHYPYSAIASLEITARDGSQWVGTGWFVSPRTVITAGHCVFVHDATNPAANGWVRSVRVVPGRNGRGSQSEPYPSTTATRFRSVAGWVRDGKAESDYAAILLDEPLGETVGTFGIGVLSDAEILASNVNVTGYPADKDGNERFTLWYHVKRTARVTPMQVFYDIDTYGGQSGAPVYITGEDGARTVVAIHAYGTNALVTSNSGTRINERVFARIHSWKM